MPVVLRRCAAIDHPTSRLWAEVIVKPAFVALSRHDILVDDPSPVSESLVFAFHFLPHFIGHFAREQRLEYSKVATRANMSRVSVGKFPVGRFNGQAGCALLFHAGKVDADNLGRRGTIIHASYFNVGLAWTVAGDCVLDEYPRPLAVDDGLGILKGGIRRLFRGLRSLLRCLA